MTNRPFDFAAEINTLFESHDFNFGKGAIPLDIVREAVLKTVCNWGNGLTAQSIILHRTVLRNKDRQLQRTKTNG